MNVFISWSGDESKPIAEKLKVWLRQVLQAVNPWMSAKDIGLGQRAADEIANKLEEYRFGILCLTPENRESKWIHFEAGALSKVIDKSRVIPICIRMKPSDLAPPLSQFQGVEANKEGMKRLVMDLNDSLPSPVLRGDLEDTFEAFWPKFESALANAPKQDFKAPTRSTADMIEEILTLTREQTRFLYGGSRQRLRSATILRTVDQVADLFFVLARGEGVDLSELTFTSLPDPGFSTMSFRLNSGKVNQLVLELPISEGAFIRLVAPEFTKEQVSPKTIRLKDVQHLMNKEKTE